MNGQIMQDKYKVSQKAADGKWRQFGNVSKNKYGNFSLGMKVTPELRKLLADAKEGGWLNFALFEDAGERKPAARPEQDEIKF